MIDKKNVLPSSEKSGCLLCKIAIEDLFFLSEVSHKKSRVLLFLCLAVHVLYLGKRIGGGSNAIGMVTYFEYLSTHFLDFVLI